ncbi:MAG: glutamate synthase, partial [Gemmatimonadetes bacterium]|nr:glutamate synthase [Gemmatimonadota bacterium]
MAELIPFPFERLVPRMFRELREQNAIFDLPAGKFYLGDADHDLSVRFHEQTAATALGPSAGPQSQLAQNLVLSWLGGSRIMELKTVQILDELEIPRPCIDAHNVGYNVEWSQELKLEQSLEEYVKGSMLIEMLVASGELDLPASFEPVIFDMSVGYDLAGIRSEGVRKFIEGMMDATEVVERLRPLIPEKYAKFRDLDFRTNLSNTLTLSTFHGCPPDEIEQIIDYLLNEHGLHCVIKLNPTLLGPDRVRDLVRDTMGYEDVVTPASAFEKDAKWDQVVAFVKRLKKTADGLGLGLGVKFTNTLIVKNHRDFFPESEKEMYLSGQPLHVLAMHLVRDFRREFGNTIPVSFSAGIDRRNFADAVALGLTPITTCTDLLRPGGYGRQAGYLKELVRRMKEVGARNVDEFIARAYPDAGDEGGARTHHANDAGRRSIDDAVIRNTEHYVETLTADPRYAQAANAKTPKKIGSHLTLFNCITCDKCIPVCPNDANFTLAMPPKEITVVKLTKTAIGWDAAEGETIVLNEKHQIANFADFCNECGNCDIFCPEDGGPYIIKPRFFGSGEDWR